jgi:myotubularin-related protein 6/7/8
VPASASNAILQGSAGFRSRGRLPVLSYLHPNGASISRCAQPLTGLNARSVEDEQLIQNISATNKNASFMYIVDTRPKVSHLCRFRLKLDKSKE